MAPFEQVLTCPDLLIIIIPYSDFETVVELLRVSRGVYLAIKSIEASICRTLAEHAPFNSRRLQHLKDETGTSTIQALSRIQFSDFIAGIASMFGEDQYEESRVVRLRPFNPSDHLCDVNLNGLYQRLPADDCNVGMKPQPHWTEWKSYQQVARSLSLLQQLSRIADYEYAKHGADNTFPRDPKCQARDILHARVKLLQTVEPQAIQALYRLRIILSTKESAGVGADTSIHACTCSACTCSARFWGWVSPFRRLRECSCRERVLFTGSTNSLLASPQTKNWLGRRFNWALPQPPWAECLSVRMVPSFHLKSREVVEQAPVVFDLFDPWTLWWFLDGDNLERGVKLLQMVWRTAKEKPGRPGLITEFEPTCKRSNLTSYQWDLLQFHNSIAGQPRPVEDVHLATGTVCSLVFRCYKAWMRSSPDERAIGREMGAQLMDAMGLKRFTVYSKKSK